MSDNQNSIIDDQDFIIENSLVLNLDDLIENDINRLEEYDMDTLLKYSDQILFTVIKRLLSIIKDRFVKTYKNSYYEPIVKFITIILCNKSNIDLTYDEHYILKIISCVANSHIYLKSLKPLIISKKYFDMEILISTALKGSFPSFLFWWQFFKNNLLSHDDFQSLLSSSIINSNDKIFKFLLEQQNVNDIDNFYKKGNLIILETILTTVNIPKKYKLRRIKIYSIKTDLVRFYQTMVAYSNTLNLLNNLSKYYYSEVLDFDILKEIFDIKEKNPEDCEIFYSNLKTIDEKNIFAIICYINDISSDKIKLYGDISNILKTNYHYILSTLVSQCDKIYNNKYLNNIIKYYSQNNYINIYLDQVLSYSEYYKYSKFYVKKNKNYIYSNYNIKINKILHLLRCLMKRKFRLKEQKFKFIFTPILKEITSYIPNDKFQVLKNGSLEYQLKNQNFNKIPPRHLLPKENILNKSFLIKEKADGILITILPPVIFPISFEIFNYEIKAEYIEELNLYLIFDIDIPNTTIYERQIFLRNIHYMTQNKKMVINVDNFDLLIKEINIEQDLLKNFINTTDIYTIKWYPKASWKILLDNQFYKHLTNIIAETNIYISLLTNKVFKSDGFILTPLDGLRELKIKPKSLQTIDLLFDGEKWVDADNKIWIINAEPNKKYINKIYRCYPKINDLDDVYYIPNEIRYDKKIPNSYHIINQIQNIFKFDWNNTNLENNQIIYYENNKIITDYKLTKIINNQKNNMYDVIKSIKPNIGKKWLDLGCGKCKLFNYIKNIYYPNKYLGIDNDINLLSKLYSLVDEFNDILNIYPASLNLKWDINNIWNSFNWNIKYDYVIANFSIMYFWTDIFWEQLNILSKEDTILIFNVVKPNSKWKFNGSYLESNNNTTNINFKWVHLQEHSEEIISEDKIIDTIKLYKWDIIKEYSFNGELADCYKWYILRKTK
jgi:hypothetical protein